MKKKFSLLFLSLLIILVPLKSMSQCCSAGSGSPVGGDGAEGVLNEYQMEIFSSLQYINSSKFFSGKSPESNFLDNFNSKFLYSRFGYGITDQFTMSVEAGYYINKTQVGLNKSDTLSSSGIADIIIFPRYNVYKKNSVTLNTELTLGLGLKIPFGTYNDSLLQVEPFSGMEYYIKKPMAVQPSSGSNDFIFHGFYQRTYPVKNTRLAMNGLYVKKGWNPNGEKFGDYTSLGVSAGKTFFDKLGINLQIKGEWIAEMEVNRDILMYSFVDYDYEATGSKKIFFTPRVSYSYNNSLNIFLLNEIPLYQHVNKTQIGSHHHASMGISYRFPLKKKVTDINTGE